MFYLFTFFLGKLTFCIQLFSVGRTQECTTSSQCKRKKNNIIIPIGASIGGFVLLLSAATATLFIMKPNTARTPEIKSNLFESKKRQFTYTEVLTITNNFERILGKGGFGAVYHGIIDNTQVAVKMLSSTSHQGYQQFEAEVCSVPPSFYIFSRKNYEALSTLRAKHCYWAPMVPSTICRW